MLRWDFSCCPCQVRLRLCFGTLSGYFRQVFFGATLDVVNKGPVPCRPMVAD